MASEFSSLPECLADVTVQDAVTHVLGQEHGDVDDMATGKLASLCQNVLMAGDCMADSWEIGKPRV